MKRPDRFSRSLARLGFLSARGLRWTQVTRKPVRSGDGIKPDRFSRESCDQSLMSARGLRQVQVTMKPVRSELAGVVARVESLRGRMSEAGRQVEGLFESLLAEAFEL